MIDLDQLLRACERLSSIEAAHDFFDLDVIDWAQVAESQRQSLQFANVRLTSGYNWPAMVAFVCGFITNCPNLRTVSRQQSSITLFTQLRFAMPNHIRPYADEADRWRTTDQFVDALVHFSYASVDECCSCAGCRWTPSVTTTWNYRGPTWSSSTICCSPH